MTSDYIVSGTRNIVTYLIKQKLRLDIIPSHITSLHHLTLYFGYVFQYFLSAHKKGTKAVTIQTDSSTPLVTSRRLARGNT